MAETPLHWQSIAALSRQLHCGDLSPVELVAHLLDRVEGLDGALNAFRLIPRERALETERASELALLNRRQTGISAVQISRGQRYRWGNPWFFSRQRPGARLVLWHDLPGQSGRPVGYHAMPKRHGVAHGQSA